MYHPPQRLRKVFENWQLQLASEHNARGRGVVRRTPSDAALADAAHSARGIEALARAYTRPII